MCERLLEGVLTSEREEGHVFEGPRDGEDKTDDHAGKHEANAAAAVIGQGAEHDREGQHMAAHHEDQEEKLGVSE